MASLFRLGQLLRGSAGTYIIQKQLHESIWLATYVVFALTVLSTDFDFVGATVSKPLLSKAFSTFVSTMSGQFSNVFEPGLPHPGL